MADYLMYSYPLRNTRLLTKCPYCLKGKLCEPHIFIDSLTLGGCCGQYHTSSLFFLEPFNLGWVYLSVQINILNSPRCGTFHVSFNFPFLIFQYFEFTWMWNKHMNSGWQASMLSTAHVWLITPRGVRFTPIYGKFF